MQVSLVAGARPNFMKIAPLVRAIRRVNAHVRIIHTGQHYDERMSETFFRELNIPEPDVNLGVGSGSHAVQIAEIMRLLEPEFANFRPDALVVVGDVNSTVAAALAATKNGIPVAHVEAGLRSFDQTMPEEINRILTDAMSRWLFTSEPAAAENLQREGISADKIHYVGNVMIDTLLAHLDAARALNAAASLGLRQREYAVLTLHRPSNVDDPERLESILRAVHHLSRSLPVVFPIHPRTRARLKESGLAERRDVNGYLAIDPQGYLSMLGLVDGARLVLTDSGGLQEETTALQVPCLTLRENTERPITVEIGSNRLVGWRTEHIATAISEVLIGPMRTGMVPDAWDGKAAERAAMILNASNRIPLTTANRSLRILAP